MGFWIVGALLILVGASLVSAPWWSLTLPRTDYALTVLLGVIFGGGGVFLSIPEDRAPRLRTLAFCMWIGAFGVCCAALALAPFRVEADGTYTVGGVPGFIGTPIPWWARLVAGFFALPLLGAAGAGLWGLAREVLRRPP